MRSVTEQAALDEFLSTAELAGTDFTAEKMNNVKIIHTDQKNPYLLSAAEERAAVGKQKAHKDRLTVPRRPQWDSTTTPEQLDRMERDSLLEWRRGLAELQENNDLLMTPFERNLEVWRQLWRVIERSDLVVQIVDARHPLLFRSEDLEKYVKHVDSRKENLLLVNKADMLTLDQRQAWADYLEAAGISYKFFSASLAKEMNEARDFEEDSESESDEDENSAKGTRSTLAAKTKDLALRDEETSSDDEGNEEEESTRILTVDELEELFLEHAPDVIGNTHWLYVKYKLTNSRFRIRGAEKNTNRSRGLSQCWKVIDYQRSDWSKEGVCLLNARKDEAFSDNSPQRQGPIV
jgi:large subunit GTPase 1